VSVPCEVIARRFLPALRALVARELIERHGLAQSRVASLLGVTQASISHYLSAKRGKLRGLICKPEELKSMAREIADKIASGSVGPEELPKLFCEMCARLKREKGLLPPGRT